MSCLSGYLHLAEAKAATYTLPPSLPGSQLSRILLAAAQILLHSNARERYMIFHIRTPYRPAAEVPKLRKRDKHLGEFTAA
jgi:hypothetical protein